MNLTALKDFKLETSSLYLLVVEAPWDSMVLGFPCVQIVKFELYDNEIALFDFKIFQTWVDKNKIGFVSCRLRHLQIKESIFLESNGFRFIEMVLHPRIDRIKSKLYPKDQLKIELARESDIDSIKFIAESVFFNERFHIDPRLGAHYGNDRYGRWVTSSLNHPSQVLLKVSEKNQLVGFFLVENREKNNVYWHLTAISSEFQGRGYGLRVWKSMINYHAANSNESISTTISARNIRVMNLYSKLQFAFDPPEMTFHWVI